MRNAGHELHEIADVLKIPMGTDTGVITRYKLRGDVENLPQTGRPRLLSVTDTMSLVRLFRTNRKTALRRR